MRKFSPRLVNLPRPSKNWIRRGFIVGCVLVTLWLLLLLYPSISGKTLGATTFGELRTDYVSEPTFLFHFYDVEADKDSIIGELKAVVLPPRSEIQPDEDFCVTSIVGLGGSRLFPAPYEEEPDYGPGGRPGGGGGDVLGFGFDELCVDQETRWYYADRDHSLLEKMDPGTLTNVLPLTVLPEYYFPFDRRSLNILIGGYGWITDTNGVQEQRPFPPQLAGWVNSPEWDARVSVMPSSISDSSITIQIDYQRPLVYRALTIGILSSLLLLIIAIVFVELSTALEVAIAVLLGLAGVRGVIVPSHVTWPIIIDPLLLSLYSLLVLAIIIRLGLHLLSRSQVSQDTR